MDFLAWWRTMITICKEYWRKKSKFVIFWCSWPCFCKLIILVNIGYGAYHCFLIMMVDHDKNGISILSKEYWKRRSKFVNFLCSMTILLQIVNIYYGSIACFFIMMVDHDNNGNCILSNNIARKDQSLLIFDVHDHVFANC